VFGGGPTHNTEDLTMADYSIWIVEYARVPGYPVGTRVFEDGLHVAETSLAAGEPSRIESAVAAR
jgi:hypothetical protein